MPESFRKDGRESHKRKGNNLLAFAIKASLHQFLDDIKREEGVSADYLSEYVLGLSGPALSQYRSEGVDRDPPHWVILKLAGQLHRLDLLRSSLSAIGVEVRWKDQATTTPQEGDLHTLMGLLASDEGKLLQAFLGATAPRSSGGERITTQEARGLSQIAHHMRRIVEDVDDRLAAIDLGDLEDAQ